MNQKSSGAAFAFFDTEGIIIERPGGNVAVLVDDSGVAHGNVWTLLAQIWCIIGSSATKLASRVDCWIMYPVNIIPFFEGEDATWRVASAVLVCPEWVFRFKTDVPDAIDSLIRTNRFLKTFAVHLVNHLSACPLHVIWESPSVNCGAVVMIIAVGGVESCLEVRVYWGSTSKPWARDIATTTFSEVTV